MSKERRNEIKKKQKSKKIIIGAAVAAVVVLLVTVSFFLSVNKCDDCGTVFFGKGYYKEDESKGVLGSAFGSLFGDTAGIPLETVDGVVICEECVKNNVSVKSELRPAKDFKR